MAALKAVLKALSMVANLVAEKVSLMVASWVYEKVDMMVAHVAFD